MPKKMDQLKREVAQARRCEEYHYQMYARYSSHSDVERLYRVARDERAQREHELHQAKRRGSQP